MKQKRAQVVVNQPTRSEERLALFNRMLVLNVETSDGIWHSLTSKTLLVENNVTFIIRGKISSQSGKGKSKGRPSTSL